MTDKKQPIGGYAPGNYYGKCTSCGEQFQGDKHALQCESCPIKDKEFYEALTPEQKERFDKRTAEIVKLFFEGRDKDEEIARLRRAFEEILSTNYDNHEKVIMKMKSIAAQALSK